LQNKHSFLRREKAAFWPRNIEIGGRGGGALFPERRTSTDPGGPRPTTEKRRVYFAKTGTGSSTTRAFREPLPQFLPLGISKLLLPFSFSTLSSNGSTAEDAVRRAGGRQTTPTRKRDAPRTWEGRARLRLCSTGRLRQYSYLAEGGMGAPSGDQGGVARHPGKEKCALLWTEPRGYACQSVLATLSLRPRQAWMSGGR
jgi:hypothetical protein